MLRWCVHKFAKSVQIFYTESIIIWARYAPSPITK